MSNILYLPHVNKVLLIFFISSNLLIGLENPFLE